MDPDLKNYLEATGQAKREKTFGERKPGPVQPGEEAPVKWRVIITDSETESGVAPVCPKPDVHAMMHGGAPTDPFTYEECCEGSDGKPHLECWGPRKARAVRDILNSLEVEVCS